MCPVFGAPVVATAAQLLIVMSGDYRSKKEVAHLLHPAVGRKVMDLGGNIEKGAPPTILLYSRVQLISVLSAPTFKLLGNSMILGSLELIAETFALSEKAGIGAPMAYSLMKELLPAPMYAAISTSVEVALLNTLQFYRFVSYGDKMLHDQFDGNKGFAIDGGLKDSQHIRRLCTELNSPMPALVRDFAAKLGYAASHTFSQDAAHQHMLTARAIHNSQAQDGNARFDVLDWSSLIAGARVAAGLDGFDSNKVFHSRNSLMPGIDITLQHAKVIIDE